MKRKKPFWKVEQRTLINDETLTESAQFILQRESPYMIPYYCTKHRFTFFRNSQYNYGYCWYCKFEILPNDHCYIQDINGKRMINIYPLQNFHVIYSDSIRESQDIDKEIGEFMAWKEQTGIKTVEWTEKGQEIVGKLIEIKENVGENQSRLFVIEKDDHEKVAVWETGFLSVPMADIKINDKIKIIYDGLGKPTQKGFKPPKLFKVFVDK